MTLSVFQKITLASCLVLCVALLLPKILLSKGKKDHLPAEDGQFPPLARRHQVAENLKAGAAHFSRPHNPEAIARTKGGTGVASGKSGLAGQIIPIYGFGILLYILYILFKITSKGKISESPECRLSTLRSENMKRKITDYELAQLHEKLQETEQAMEQIVSKASKRCKGVSLGQEEKLLLQLREITLLMNRRGLLEDMHTPKQSVTTQQWMEEGNSEDDSPESENLYSYYHGDGTEGFQERGE